MEIKQQYHLTVCANQVLRVFVLLLCVFIFFNAVASESNNDNAVNKSQPSRAQVEYYLKDNTINQIPYFDNRFRLDANLEEITLIFYRKSGSTPIILIRPDGSKIRVNNFDYEKIQWFDDSTFDMIKIKNPMPGPWQAVGNILPNSQIFVVSDVTISVEPIPEIAFSGETLKVEGKLFNGDEQIKSPGFKKVVHLDVNFYSTNNSKYENFGADAIKVTSFRDDGYGLDEYASDNIFTGEFVLDFAPGEWQPVYIVKMPMSTRELRQTPIKLQKTPVEISVNTALASGKPHELLLTIDPSYVDPDSLIFQGKFVFPDRQEEPFSIMDSTGVTRKIHITNTEPGIYRVNVNAFGKTTTGREFRLVVPEFSFNVEAEESELIATLDGGESALAASTEQLLLKAEQDKALALEKHQEALAKKEQETILLIVAGNGVIVIIGLITFLALRRKKKLKKVSAI